MNFKEFLESTNNQDKLNAEIIKLAAKQPDFVYNTFGERVSCNYTGPAKLSDVKGENVEFGPDCKGCLFGTAAQNLGVSDFGDQATNNIHCIIPYKSKYYPTWGRVQKAQDNGSSWGEAIKLLETE